MLNQIKELFQKNLETPFGHEYDHLINGLSFSNTTLHPADSDTLKQAWSRFLANAYGHETNWEWPCNVGIADWYVSNNKLEHAIAVYEHLYAQIRRGEMAEYEENYQEWLLHLFQLSSDRGLTLRARHVAELIGDYYTDGLISPVAYAEILAAQDGLRYRELEELIDGDRHSVEQRLRTEVGPLIDGIHSATRNHIIDAEVWSHSRLQDTEPTISPRRFALAIEAEFHYKVFEPNRIVLEPALRSPTHRAPRVEHCCDLGQILHLVRLSNHVLPVKGIFSRLNGGPGLTIVPNTCDVLDLVRTHRNQFSHSGSGGLYSKEKCGEFLKTVKASGWIFSFLSALQPR